LNNGTTEYGSSGAPLLDQDKRVIGQLQGGFPGCPTSSTGITNYYGRFDVSWADDNNIRRTRDNRLRDYLDPLGTNPITLDGIGQIRITNTHIPCPTATYTLNYPALANWSIPASSGFRIVGNANNVNSVTVEATRFEGQTGTLTAVINGTTVTRQVSVCKPETSFSHITICMGQPMEISASGWFDSYRWDVSSNLRINGSNSNSTVSITGTRGGEGWIRIMSGTTQLVRYGVTVHAELQILGPSVICSGGSAVFIATCWQPGYSWFLAGGLTMTHGGTTSTESQITVRTIPGINGAGVYIQGPGVLLATKSVRIGGPVLRISGPSQVFLGRPASFTASVSMDGDESTDWEWVLESVTHQPPPPSYINPLSSSRNSATVTFGASGRYRIGVRGRNRCGWGNYNYFTVDVLNFAPFSAEMSNITAYPNPVSDLLNIELTQEPFVITRTLTTHDVRLYDSYGNIVRQVSTQSESVQFNLSNLPIGIYYLHIYNGVDENPEIRQIVVER
jgi:hypothetical protein